jgi:hypothetical protein
VRSFARGADDHLNKQLPLPREVPVPGLEGVRGDGDRLPAGLVYVASKAKAKLSGGRYCWTAKTLGPGKSTRYRITVRTLGGASGAMLNRATTDSAHAKTAKAQRKVRCSRPRAAAAA